MDARPTPIGASEVEQHTFPGNLCVGQGLVVLGLPFRSIGNCRDKAQSDQEAKRTAPVHSPSYRRKNPWQTILRERSVRFHHATRRKRWQLLQLNRTNLISHSKTDIRI